MKPFISVVIPAHNEEKYIEETIDSIQKQVFPQGYEIIVVDNASTDNTSAVAKRLGVTVIYEPEPGLAYARRVGLKAAQGDILAYIDADTRIPKGWLTQMKEYFELHPEVSGVSCNFYFFEKLPVGQKIYQFFFQHFVLPFSNTFLSLLHKPEMFWGLCMVLRTESLKKAGGINMDFVFYGEDTSLAYRLHTQGKVKFLSRIFVSTSARSYMNGNGFAYLYKCTVVFLSLHFGFYTVAKRFATQHITKK